MENKDDALFEALGEKKKRRKRRITVAVTAVAAVAVVLAVAGVFLLRQRVQNAFSAEPAEVLSAPVNVGAINAVVTGTGNLAEMDLEAVTVPEGVEITQIPVKVNQTVEEGDILATVDMTSVTNALADAQARIEELDARISKADGGTVSGAVCAGVSGRVKVIYGKPGDNVADVVADNGALALLSLDGYMSLSVRTSTLTAGDRVSVVLSDGGKQDGFVEDVSGSYATVLITDNGTERGDRVKVYNTEGKEIGAGTLEIHSLLRVTAYTGTIAAVKVKAEDKVSESTKLFTLQETDYSAGYHTLLRQREALEQTVISLLTIQRDGAVLATAPGGVYSIDHSESAPEAVVTLAADDRMSVTVAVDESDILSLSMGQRATVLVPSVGDKAYTGIVMEVSRSADGDGNFSALVEMNKEKGMLPGMTANVSIRIRGEEGALTIPVEAVHKTRNGAYVYTGYDPETREYSGRKEVVIGLENSKYAEILDGIGIGDTVYYTKKQTESDDSSQDSLFPYFGGDRG